METNFSSNLSSRSAKFTLLVMFCCIFFTHLENVRADSPDVSLLKNVMVPARDDVRLATDIYLPAESGKSLSGPFPTILIRTPYGKSGLSSFAEYFAKIGYAVMAQDVRGRYDSEGDFYIYLNEGKDGYDAVEWAALQNWCNGNVGTYGGSYLAATQNALAVERPPHLNSMFIIVGTSNYIEDGAGRGGAFALLHNMVYAFRLAGEGKEAINDGKIRSVLGSAYSNLADWLKTAPLKSNSPLYRAPTYQKWYSDWREHSTYDAYWKQNGYNFEEYHSLIPDIPIYFVGGLYDIFKRGTLKNFEGISGRNKFTKLLMGPWTHSTGITYSGDVDFGPAAELNIRNEAERFFNQFLKGINSGILEEQPVKYFLMGGGNSSKNKSGRLQSGGEWKTEDIWPPAGFNGRDFYLHGNGMLRRSACWTESSSQFQFNPADPVPTIGGNIDSGKDFVPRGAQNQVPGPDHFAASNQLPLSSRRDILTFETEPLKEDIEVTGPVSVHLWVSSEALDTDFTAKLVDVYPPSDDYPEGYAMNIEDGILRMRFRNSREREVLMTPGNLYQITIDLWAISNRFLKDHRIRLDISSSNFPMYDVNPNTGEPLGHHTHLLTTLNSVYFGPDHPSRLILPVRAE